MMEDKWSEDGKGGTGGQAPGGANWERTECLIKTGLRIHTSCANSGKLGTRGIEGKTSL